MAIASNFQRKHLIGILRRPAIATAVKDSYARLGSKVPLKGSESPASAPEELVVPSEPPTAVQQLQDSAELVRAALYEQSAKGFGEWRMWLSERAQGDLQKKHKADVKEFGIIMRKLKSVFQNIIRSCF